MMMSSNGNIFRVTGPLCRNSPHKGQWRGAMMFSFICARTNGWVNNRRWIETPSCSLCSRNLIVTGCWDSILRKSRTSPFHHIWHSSYNVYWCPGDARNKSISSNAINLIHHQYSDVSTRALSQCKDGLSRCEDFHYKDKMVMRPSYLYNGNPYTGKTTSLYWDASLNVLNRVLRWCGQLSPKF